MVYSAYVSSFLLGLITLPFAFLLCKLLRLDKEDTHCVIISSSLSALFCIIYGLVGLFGGV